MPEEILTAQRPFPDSYDAAVAITFFSFGALIGAVMNHLLWLRSTKGPQEGSSVGKGQDISGAAKQLMEGGESGA